MGQFFLAGISIKIYMLKEFSRTIYAFGLTVPNQRVNRDVFCQLAQIPKQISKNLLNEDKGIRQCNPLLQNSRRNVQHRRIVPESAKNAPITPTV